MKTDQCGCLGLRPAKSMRGTFMADGNVLTLDCDDGCTKSVNLLLNLILRRGEFYGI